MAVESGVNGRTPDCHEPVPRELTTRRDTPYTLAPRTGKPYLRRPSPKCLSDCEMRGAPEEFILVFTSLGSTEAARAFVRQLVDERLVACGTILPRAESVYRWEGKVTTSEEAVVLLKTTRDRWDALSMRVRDLHPYQVPELLAVPVDAGLEPYLAWVSAETMAEGSR